MKTTHYNGPNAHRGSRLSNRKQSALRILMLQYFTHKQLNLPVSHDNTAKYTAEKKTHVNATRGRAQRGVKKDTKLQFHGRWQCSYTTTPFTQLGPLSSYGTEGDRTMEAPPRDWKQNSWDHLIYSQGRNPLFWHLESPIALKTITPRLLW